jgi:hypothetical protein
MRLPESMAARIGAVAATAAIAITGATAAANAATAAPAVHKIPTTLTISNSTPVGHRHQTTAVINGHLTAGAYNLRHLRVYLERLGLKGRWHVVNVALTRSHGHVFFRVHILKKAASFRLVFRGTRHFAKSISDVDTISPATAS